MSRRTTGASIVEDADLTNSPISLSWSMTALLSTPNSFASSYTRTFATTLLLGPVPWTTSRTPARAERAPGRPQPMVIIAACSSSAHQLLDLLSDRCSLLALKPAIQPGLFRLGQCYSGDSAPRRYSASESRLSGPVVRKARGNARRRRARSRHARLGCRYAPRPGSRAGGSGWMASPAATRRSRLDLAARSLQPTQVRITGVSGACRSARVAITSSSLPPSQACRTGREFRRPAGDAPPRGALVGGLRQGAGG